MPKITEIKPQKNKKRVNIYLDGSYGFGLDLENFVKLGLEIGRELGEVEIEEIIKKAQFQKNYDKALRFTSLRPRSKRELQIWFTKHKVPETLKKEIIARLEKLELVDDRKFAAWWVGQRLEFGAKSKRALLAELKQKGVPGGVVEEVIKEAGVDERSSAIKLLEKKSRLWRGLDEFSARRKKSEYLFRNGYPWSVIREVV